MNVDKRERLAAEQPDNVKFLEAAGYVWNPRRTSFIKTRNDGEEAVITDVNVCDWSLEVLKKFTSPFPAHKLKDFRK